MCLCPAIQFSMQHPKSQSTMHLLCCTLPRTMFGSALFLCKGVFARVNTIISAPGQRGCPGRHRLWQSPDDYAVVRGRKTTGRCLMASGRHQDGAGPSAESRGERAGVSMVMDAVLAPHAFLGTGLESARACGTQWLRCRLHCPGPENTKQEVSYYQLIYQPEDGECDGRHAWPKSATIQSGHADLQSPRACPNCTIPRCASKCAKEPPHPSV